MSDPLDDTPMHRTVLAVVSGAVLAFRPLFTWLEPGVDDPWAGRLTVAAFCSALLLATFHPAGRRRSYVAIQLVTVAFGAWMVWLMARNGFPDGYLVGALLTSAGALVLFRTAGEVSAYGAGLASAVAATVAAGGEPRGLVFAACVALLTVLVALATARRNRVEDALAAAGRELADRVAVRTAELARRTAELEVEAVVRRAAEENALAATRAKSSFLAAMSHELRTPLTGILGYAELIAEDESVPPSIAADVGQIGIAGRQLLGLVDEVLDLARIESGRLEIVRGRIAVRPLVEEILGTIAPKAERQGTVLRSAVDPAAAAFVGDALRVRQILLNLAGNAVRHAEAGVVEVRARRVGDDLWFEVADDGPGLPGEVRSHLFERFVRAGADGVGLGLAISHELALAMGGSLELVPTAVGTTFRLRLPGTPP